MPGWVLITLMTAGLVTALLGLLSPLVAAGLIAPDEALSINAVSGYTGGGKELIAEYENGAAPDFFVYGLGQAHKHLPEIMLRAGLTRRPVFAPAVGRYAQGMMVQLPLQLGGRRIADLRGATSPRLLLEVMCARMLLPAADDAQAALLQRIEALERRDGGEVTYDEDEATDEQEELSQEPAS